MDSISYASDSGNSSTLSQGAGSFAYPGELLTDNEFTQEFSSSCSSSQHGSTSLNVTLVLDSKDGNWLRIPTPPPPPPLLRSPPHKLPANRRTAWDSMLSLDSDLTDDTEDTWDTCIVCYTHIHHGETPQIQHCCSTAICAECVINSLLNNPELTLPVPCLNPNCASSCMDLYESAEDSPKAECIVCFDKVTERSNKRKCCRQVICKGCIREIIRTNIEDEGKSHILCPNPECKKGVIGREEILKYISGETKEKYERFRLQESGETDKKTCPNCCVITQHKLPGRFRRYREEDVRITCSMCQFDWCFRCHSPWHEAATCKQFQRGDKQFKKWTKSRTRKGDANCQKCPLCRVYIQRSTGCNHMTCNRCKTEFCYKCGGFYNGLPGLGDHYSKTSIFGCKYEYKANQPIQRKAIRGGYLGAKLAMLTGYPVLFVAGVVVVVLVGAVALPIYGGYRYYKFKKRTKNLYRSQHRHH